MSRILRLILPLALTFLISPVFAQTTRLTGTVTDKTSGEKLPGVTVIVKGTTAGASTNEQGRFSLSTSANYPLTLQVSYIGYKPVEQQVTVAGNVNFALEKTPVLGQEVVVAASRTPERILESPVTIERMGAAAVRETGSPSFYDAITNFKGVQSSVQSLTFRSLSTRGFNANGNIRFNQFVDGMDNQAPGLNFSVGNVVGLHDIDVESAELLPGAASALYGAGGTNGTLLMTSKDPFVYQGLTVSLKTGVNHLDQRQRSRRPYTDVAFRYAKAFGNKWAFKVNTSWTHGGDWQANDYSNFDRATGTAKAGNRSTDPRYDGVNTYGDEPNAAYPTLQGVATAVQAQTRAGILAAGGPDIVAALNASLPANATTAQIGAFISALPATLRPSVTNLVPFYFGLRNSTIPNQSVTRTGYEENVLVNYDAESFKVSGALHYRLSDKITAVAQANWGKGTSVYTGSDRYSLGGFDIGQYKLELKSPDFFVRGYTTQERSGDAYNATLLGTYLNEYTTPSTTWFPDYTGTYANARNSGASEEAAHNQARAFADRNRLQPQSAAFEALKTDVTSRTIGPAGGAKFNDQTNLYHAEGMYNFTDALNNVAEVQVGSSYRTYNLHSDGTIFDDLSRNISINEFGAFVQAGKRLFADKFKLTGAIRYDKNENFEGRFTPRVSGVFTAAGNHNLRASYQTGFRNPTTQNQYIDLLVGGSSGVRLIGGLPEIITKYNLNANKGYTLASVNRFRQTGNAADLQRYTFGEFKPESVQAYEIGYKGLFNNTFLLDVVYYRNAYKDFISTLILLQPTVAQTPTDPLGTPRTISTTVNNTNTVIANGVTLGGDYLAGKYTISGNTTWNKLKNDDTVLNSEFNTPEWRVNLGLAGQRLFKYLGFNINYRWQDDYTWVSSFAAGKVDAFGTVDAQVNYKFKGNRSMLKIGGSNIFNNYYRTSFGNPSVGGIYYVSILFDQFMR